MIFRCCPLAAAGWGHLTKRLKGSRYTGKSSFGGSWTELPLPVYWRNSRQYRPVYKWCGAWGGGRVDTGVTFRASRWLMIKERPPNCPFLLKNSLHTLSVATKWTQNSSILKGVFYFDIIWLRTLTFPLHSKPSREHLLIWNTADCSADGNPLKKTRPFCWKSAPAVKTNWPTVGLLRCKFSTDTAPQIFLNSTQSLCIAQMHTRCRLHIASVHGARASTPRGANGCTTWPQPSLPCPVDIRPVLLMMMIVITIAHNYIITLPHWHRNIYRNRTLSLALIYKVFGPPKKFQVQKLI